MTSEEEGEVMRPRSRVPHYYGDSTRALFVIGAIVLVVAQSTGADLPLTTLASVIGAATLVVAAGVTSPLLKGIHWLNAFLAITGTLIFGTSAIDRYRAGANVLDGSFVFIEALALISLLALYFTTRTIRGIQMRSTRLP